MIIIPKPDRDQSRGDPFDRHPRQLHFQDQDRKVSWSPQLLRIISRVINYQLSLVFSLFLSKDKDSSMFQDFRFEGYAIFENSTSIKLWLLKSVSLFYIDKKDL